MHEVSDDTQSFNNNNNYATIGIAFLLLFVGLQYIRAQARNIDVPAVGPSGFITSYYAGFRWLFDARSMVQEGYNKFNGRAFKVARLDAWHVVIGDQQLIEELRTAPEDQLSFYAAVNDEFAVNWTLGPSSTSNPYPVLVIRSQLTRNMDVVFDAVKDEVEQSFKDIVPASDDWVGYPTLNTMMEIICRTSSRASVGLPLCRNPDFLKLNIDFTVDVGTAAAIINIFPEFLKPFVGKFMTTVQSNTRRAMRHLRPIIEERRRMQAEHGKDFPDKPVDILSWLMDDAPEGEEQSVKALTLRILNVNFAAIHTSSLSFTHALFHLASKPEYIVPIREEVENIIRREGWTKGATSKMRKLDSFLKESQRYSGILIMSMTRKAMQDYKFTDGTFIPKGVLVSVASTAMHFDDANYENAGEFDGFRFVKVGDKEDDDSARDQMVSTSPDYLAFGHGRHACPGRFFAANEMKVMMAYMLMNYDMKMETEGVRPKDKYIGAVCLPDPKGRVMLRKREK